MYSITYHTPFKSYHNFLVKFVVSSCFKKINMREL